MPTSKGWHSAPGALLQTSASLEASLEAVAMDRAGDGGAAVSPLPSSLFLEEELS